MSLESKLAFENTSNTSKIQSNKQDSIVETPFLSVLKQESKESPQFIKVGDITYRTTSDKKTFQTFNTNKIGTNITDKTEKTIDKSDHDPGHVPDESLNEESKAFQSGLQIQLSPVNSDQFLKQLPHALRSFIQETVSVIKQVKSTGSDIYIFKFEKVNLNVAMQYSEDKLVIIIQAGEALLADQFSKQENLQRLHQILQQRFSEMEITIRIVDEETFLTIRR
jgi:hypothetical protein